LPLASCFFFFLFFFLFFFFFSFFFFLFSSFLLLQHACFFLILFPVPYPSCAISCPLFSEALPRLPAGVRFEVLSHATAHYKGFSMDDVKEGGEARR
jgi:hypothetical protein